MSDRTGCLWIADISGYTSYLNASELQHAEETLTELLSLLVERPGPPLVVSKLEGDAVFAYAEDDVLLDGQTFAELVEDTYVAFKETVELMVLNNSCRCNACANVSALDLKFVIHHGRFRIQEIGDHRELVGPDVNLVHRLMKNRVTEATGFDAYCIYTDEARLRLGLGEMEGLVSHVEDVDDFGQVATWVQDLSKVYERRRRDGRPGLADDEVEFTHSVVLPMPPHQVWGYLADTTYRSLLSGSDRQTVGERSGGRTGPGSVYLCYHGSEVVPQVVLEWDPFERIVTQDSWSKPWKATSIAEIDLTPHQGGTRLTQTYGGTEGSPLVRMLGKRLFKPVMARMQAGHLDDFVASVTRDWEDRMAEPPIAIDAVAVTSAAREALGETTGGLDQ